VAAGTSGAGTLARPGGGADCRPVCRQCLPATR